MENVNIYIDKRGIKSICVNMTFRAHYCKTIKTRDSNPMFWSKLHITSGESIVMPPACASSQQSKIFSNSCSFLEIWEIHMLVLPWMVGASSYIKPWICP